MLPDINFQNIRPLKNSKNYGFEELCVQLFRHSFSAETTFFRVDDGGGDGGVEDIAHTNNRKKVGLQAKYFNQLKSPQWAQINKSVKTAIDNHPTLKEYRIATPINRSKKEEENWTSRTDKWNEYAKEKGFKHKIKFVWWGDTELRDLLTTPTHTSKVFYWFGTPEFSFSWLKEQFDVTLENLDCRYTPKQHVRTEAEEIIDAFSLTNEFIKELSDKCATMLNAARKTTSDIHLEDSSVQENKKSISELSSNFSFTFDNALSLPSCKELQKTVTSFSDAADILAQTLYDLQETEMGKSETKRNDGYGSRPYSSEIRTAEALQSATYTAGQFLSKYSCYSLPHLLIEGDAGTGKSHLLAKCIESALNREQPAVLLLGDQFLSPTNPWVQLIQNIGWDHDLTALLSALNTQAQVSEKPAIIAIDALNESEHRSLWKKHLNAFAAQLKQYPNIRLLISCRTDFSPITLPPKITEGNPANWGKCEHQGFGDQVFEAVINYFDGYSIKSKHFPPLVSEFQNPLFLKTFCEAFAGEEIPSTPISFDRVMGKRIDKVAELIRDKIDCDPDITKQALHDLAKQLSECKALALLKNQVKQFINDLFPATESKSLYRHLLSNGLIVEVIHHDYSTQKHREMVRFPYERFSDYFIANYLLTEFTEASNLIDTWRNLNYPQHWAKSYHRHKGLLSMLSILLPERFGIELISLFSDQKFPRGLLNDFMESMAWRSPPSFSDETEDIIQLCADNLPYQDYIQHRLKMSTIPEHPYNFRRIHLRLKEQPLHIREQQWTITISRIAQFNNGNVPDSLIRWAFNVPTNLVSDEQAELVGLMLTWFCSSNFRGFRTRATLAAIRILNGRPTIAAKLIEEFHDCNDPYVVERAYAIVCGVALRETTDAGLRHLATVVYNHMFSGEYVPPNILQRDYAQAILDYADYRSVLSSDIDIHKFRPPFRSLWPRIISEAVAKDLESDDRWNRITSSVTPNEENMCMYGDFGRYVMESNVHNFSSITFKQPPARTQNTRPFSAVKARRYILQRIKQLGWTPERYGDYERTEGYGRGSADIEKVRVERISKKYQWIALYELLGYLSDRYRMAHDPWAAEQPIFNSTKDLWVREFDPTQPCIDLEKNNADDDDDIHIKPPHNTSLFEPKYPDPFHDIELRLNRKKWIKTKPFDFSSLIEHHSIPEHPGQWLTLSAHYGWDEHLLPTQNPATDGRLRLWADVRCWLVPKMKKQSFIAEIKDINFHGSGCRVPELSRCFLGEYPWATHLKDFRESYKESRDEWLWRHNPTFTPMATVGDYHDEAHSTWATLPSPHICDLLGLYWAGSSYSYMNSEHQITALSLPCKHASYPCLIHRDRLLSALTDSEWNLVWGVLSEKSCWSSETSKHIVREWAVSSSVYSFENGSLVRHSIKYDSIPLYR